MNKPKAYVGDQPYIFISYSHKDKDIVYPEIEWIQNQGFRVWYDEGIEFGNKWPDELAKAIEECDQFVVFVSGNSIGSTYVNKEINFAINLQKKILPIYLENIELPSSLSFKLSDIQAIQKSIISEEDFMEFLNRGLSPTCKGVSVSRGLNNTYIPSYKRSSRYKSGLLIIPFIVIILGLTAVIISMSINKEKDRNIFTGNHIIEAPTITNPQRGVELQPGQDVQVAWNTGKNAEYYLVDLKDLTANKIVLDSLEIQGNSYMIDGKLILTGHKYRLSVKSVSRQISKPSPDWPDATIDINVLLDKKAETTGLIRSEVLMDNDYWIQDDTLNYKYIDAELDGKGESEQIKIGNDTPMGIGEKVIVFMGDMATDLLNLKSPNSGNLTDLYSDSSLKKGNKIQVGCYDFDNDGNKEIILAIGDELVSLDVSIFKYVGGEKLYEEIGHFEGQEYLYITKEGYIDVPYGSQGLFVRYALKNGKFIQEEGF